MVSGREWTQTNYASAKHGLLILLNKGANADNAVPHRGNLPPIERGEKQGEIPARGALIGAGHQPSNSGENGHEDPKEANKIQQPQHEGRKQGFLPPTNRGDDDCAENRDLPNPKEGQNQVGVLPPTIGEEEGILPPTRSGEAAISLTVPNNGQNEEKEGQYKREEGMLPPATRVEAKGDFQPITKVEGVFLPNQGDQEAIQEDSGLPANGVPEIGPSFSFNLAKFQSHGHAGAMLQIFLMKIMHVALEKPDHPCMVHNDVFNYHAKSRVLPKVKKKNSLLFCLSIHLPFHPGEHQLLLEDDGGHDGWETFYPHHEPSHPCSIPTSSPLRSAPSFPQATHKDAGKDEDVHGCNMCVFIPHQSCNSAILCVILQPLQVTTTDNKGGFKDAIEDENAKPLMVVTLYICFLGTSYVQALQNQTLSKDDPFKLFPPLRGSNHGQARKKLHHQFQVHVQMVACHAGIKVKTKLIMLLMIHAELDPG